MKNKTIKLACTGIMILSIMLLLACTKKSTEPEKEDSTTPSALVGTWNSTSMIIDMFITINSAQTIADMFSEGTGAISITGAHQVDLKYMVGMEEEGMTGLIVTNQPFLGSIIYPAYSLILFEQLNMSMLMVQTSATDTLAYVGLFGGFNYNPTTYTLTATNAQLFAIDFSSVTANGTLTNTTVNVPANTPTKIFSMENPEEMQMTYTLSANGTYTGTIVFEDSIETEAGLWEVSGNTVTMITVDTVDNVVKIDTTTSTYSLSSGVLTIIQEMDACEDEEDSTAECLAGIEEQFGLNSGSLTAATQKLTITFSKTVAKWSPQPSKISNWSRLNSISKINKKFFKILNN